MKNVGPKNFNKFSKQTPIHINANELLIDFFATIVYLSFNYFMGNFNFIDNINFKIIEISLK